MHTLHLLPLLLLLLNLTNAVPTRTPTHSHPKTPWIAASALDALIAQNPHPFSQPPDTDTNTTTTSLATSRIHARDSIRITVPIPNDPLHRRITLLLHPHTHPLVPYQLEAILTATNALYTHLLHAPGVGVNAVLPPEAYPLVVKPGVAMGAYLELEMGEEGGMRVGTLGLVVRGLWEGMVGGRRWVEVAFEVWDGNHKHVGDGIIANEESSLRMSS